MLHLSAIANFFCNIHGISWLAVVNSTIFASILYKPLTGKFRGDQIAASDDQEGSLTAVYQNASDLLSSEVYDVQAWPSIGQDEYPSLVAPQVKKQKDTKAQKTVKKELLELEIRRSQDLGYKVLKKFKVNFKNYERKF